MKNGVAWGIEARAMEGRKEEEKGGDGQGLRSEFELRRLRQLVQILVSGGH